MTMHLGISEVAALLNVSLILVQITYPLLVALVSVGTLKHRVNAATWSIFGRLLNSTFWPNIIGTDSAGHRNVDRRVRLITFMSNIAAILLVVAAAITPLGLYATTGLSEPKGVTFTYIKDTSPLGQATQPRDRYISSRLCGDGICPGNKKGFDWGLDHQYANPFIDLSIAPNITRAFTSATNTSTVAGVLDIEYRLFDHTRQFIYGSTTTPHSLGNFHYFQQFLEDSGIKAVEGLLVSTTARTGIAFRNHTLPPSSVSGCTWKEDLLWLEPETVCTNLNITLDYTMPGYYTVEIDARLTDRGGFVNAPFQYPHLSSQPRLNDPQLYDRSKIGAIWTTKTLAGYLNIANNSSYIGKEYKIMNQGFNSPIPNAIAFSTFGDNSNGTRALHPHLPSPLSVIGPFGYGGPSGAEEDEGGSILRAVRGYQRGDQQNASIIGIDGGLLLGAGVLVDTQGLPVGSAQGFEQNPGTKWTHPIYSCVSAIKASVKTVHFELKGEMSVSNLRITDVRQRNPPSGVWAIEDAGFPLDYLDPFWGLVSSETAKSPSLLSFSDAVLYLPAGSSSFLEALELLQFDAVAGLTVTISGISPIYRKRYADNTYYPDYTGAIDWPLFTMWQNFSRNETTTGRIIDLIWTDIMANALVGTKSSLRGSEQISYTGEAAQYYTTVGYDWRYAIAALVFATLYLVLLLATLVLFTVRKCKFATLRKLLNQTSAGRCITTERFQGGDKADQGSTKEWSRIRGAEIVYVREARTRDVQLTAYRSVSADESET